MTIGELNYQLTQALKTYVKSSNHNDTGRLYNSIQFKCTTTNGLTIKFDAMEYIHYLDDGDFINNFFEQSSILDLIATYLVDSFEINQD